MTFRAAAVIAFFVALAPGAAHATCVAAFTCLCDRALGKTAVGELVSVEQERSRFRVVARYGGWSGPASDAGPVADAGEELVVTDHEDGDEPGLRVILLGGEGSSFIGRINPNADGLFECPRSTTEKARLLLRHEPFTLPLERAAEIAAADDCYAQLHDEGFRELPCNDTPSSCGLFPAAAIVPAFAFATLRRRRRELSAVD